MSEEELNITRYTAEGPAYRFKAIQEKQKSYAVLPGKMTLLHVNY